ncbi:hypothetical protein [Blastopirellula marina]|uniref:Uncharacterized protein n=1 Tax=Blastopirellula marina DSM 3645 TaxID=314230 RepID=A3ZX47_9BACT|nr:hypothetical protein [Blastopirellula marina]EAQ78924.1 hypothetical protein DSM3645_27628 [Blastopirellula marina DSM 3645]
MFAQSQPDPDMLDWMPRLKTRHGLRIIVGGNEARELIECRIQKFRLNDLVNASISSSFVLIRKLDLDVYRLPLDISQALVAEITYIKNRSQVIDLAEQRGIRSILHTDCHSTRVQLASYGLKEDGGGEHGSC